MKEVQPLDAQFGVWPRKTVPEDLREPLFGQMVPTEAEIVHHGGAERVPRIRTYAILDAAKVFGMVEMLENSGLDYRSLFQGQAEEDYRDVAPYMVELEENHPFTEILFTHRPDLPENMTTLHMWHKEPGIYVRSRFGFEILRKHFRKFTKLQDEDGKWFYFRFWEAGNASILKSQNNDPASPFISMFHNKLIQSACFPQRHQCLMLWPVLEQHRKSKREFLRPDDFDETHKLRRAGFMKKVLTALEKDHPLLAKQADSDNISRYYQLGRERGYRVELASYNFIRSSLLARSKGASFDAVENLVDPDRTLSPLTRSKLIWEYLQTGIEASH